MERLLDWGGRWLVRGLLGLALVWGASFVLLVLPGPWSWFKLILLGPLIVAVWTVKSVSRQEGAWTSVSKALIGSFVLLGIAMGIKGHVLPSVVIMMIMVPAVFFIAPAVLVQSRMHVDRQEHAKLRGD